MKILLLIDNLHSGGAETHVELLARELLALGHEVCVASSGGAIADRLALLGIKQLRLPLLKINKKSNLLSLLYRCTLSKNLISRYIHKEKPEIIHAHTRKMAFLVHSISRKAKIPLIVTAHSRASMQFPKNLLSKWGDLTIAVSQDIKTHLIANGIPSCQIEVINNGVYFPTNSFLMQAQPKGEKE